jgi:hypothetical protein
MTKPLVRCAECSEAFSKVFASLTGPVWQVDAGEFRRVRGHWNYDNA